ncbi:MAG TPA: bifunctional YncE family protein/alkaline phosphatase family protein [Sphingobacteriaceae bacterium]
MKKNLPKSASLLVLFALILSAISASSQEWPTNNPNAKDILLPNGWTLSPVGKSLPLGDLPLNIQVSRSKQLMAVTNNGQSTHSIQLIDLLTDKVTDEAEIGKAWYGLQFSKNGRMLYASGANDNIILCYPVSDKKLGKADTIFLSKNKQSELFPTGIAVDKKNKFLYTVTKEDKRLYVVNLKNKKVVKTVDLGAEGYSCALSRDEKTLFISVWGGDRVAFYDIASGKINATVNTESHPNELLLNKKGNYLYVANANSNSVSVIDVRSKKVMEVISTTLYPTKLTGSTTNGLAFSEDEKTLYIANADNNCIAVFDVSTAGQSSAKGFIPTGWYPTSIKIVGNKIYVANGKGFSSFANPEMTQPVSKDDDVGMHIGPTDAKKKRVQYIGSLFKGTLSIIDIPDSDKLLEYSKKVYQNMPLDKSTSATLKVSADNPVPTSPDKKSPIKYVFYVIKENRTYDQVFGDMKKGNGDSSLCIFPEKVTPNQHALANEFVLLDNFYVDAEVSADGHNWSMAAYATDFVEKLWPTQYGGRGKAESVGTRKIAHPKDGFIWDYCKRAGVSYRTYGEFVSAANKPYLSSLEGHNCLDFAPFNMTIRDTDRFEVWKRDFDSLLVNNKVAQFNTIRLGEDHTSGQKLGAITPVAAVASNDLAVGKLVEHISKSSIWNESAIFILEDDAQNGPDHVDAHRSIAFVISPYTKRNAVVSTMYSTTGMLRTMELILGLPPMSQYDASALPMYDCFTSTPNLTPFTHLPARVNLNTRNTANNKSSIKSRSFDLSKEDSVPDLLLNEVVWKSVKGEDSEMPAPRRSAFVKLEDKGEED